MSLHTTTFIRNLKVKGFRVFRKFYSRFILRKKRGAWLVPTALASFGESGNPHDQGAHDCSSPDFVGVIFAVNDLSKTLRATISASRIRLKVD
jgi:hypothetical protein